MFNFKKFFKICLPLILVCLNVQPVFASDTSLSHMYVDVDVQEDGSAMIEETWEMSVYEGTEVYKVLENMGESHVKNLIVKDDKGNKYTTIKQWDSDKSFEEKINKCGIIQDDDHYEICFGISEYGNRKYTFTYTITNFVKQYTDAQGFNYAFFSDMDLTPYKATVTLSSKKHKFSEDNSAIWGFGYRGSVKYNQGKVVMKTDVHGVDEGGKLQLLMKIDDGTFEGCYRVDESIENIISEAKEGSNYSDSDYYQDGYYSAFQKEKNNTFIYVAIAGVVLAGLGVCFLIGYCLKIDGKLVFDDGQSLREWDDIPMFRDIPCHKDLYEFYYLANKVGMINDDDNSGLIAGVLLRWIQKGYIHFEKKQEKYLKVFKKNGYAITFEKEFPLANKVEEKLLSFFKKAAGSNGILETDEFEDWCLDHYEELDEWFDEVEEMIEKQYRQQHLLTLGSTTTHYLGMNIKRDADVYSASLRDEMEHVIGLEKFLTEMSSIHEKEVIEVKMWEEYLIFASILGIAEEVQKELGKMCPTFNEQSRLDTIYTMDMVRIMSYQSVQTARSSGAGGSASFGGGGSFSGGGGGGVR